jgi:outer membrane protein, multidrug efflux system
MKFRIIMIIFVFISSCSFNPAKKRIDIEIPESFNNSPIMNRDSIIYNEWWKALDNKELNSLVEKGISTNLDIKIAISRVKQFEAIFNQRNAQKLPNASLSNNVSISYLPDPKGDDFQVQENRQLNLGLSYTVDIWGKIASQTNAANADFTAMKYDLQSGYDKIISTIIQLYFDIKSSQKRLLLLNNAYQVYTEHTDLQNQRYIRGIGTDLNVYLSEQEVVSAKRDIIREQKKLLSYKYELSVLIGEFPNEHLISNSSMLFEEIQDKMSIPNIIPSNLLKHKPELKYYEYKLESARQNAGAVKADRFPQLSISANVSLTGESFGDLFDFDNSFASTLSKQGTKILFSGGLIEANEKQSIELYQQAFFNYKKAILTAFKETENLLLTKESVDKEFLELKKQYNFSEQIVRLRENYYLRGIGRYDDFITAQKSHFLVAGNLISAENEFIKTHINLLSHIGGLITSETISN